MQLVKPSSCRKLRQLVVIVDQLAGGDAGGGLDAQFMENFVGAFDLSANVRQAAIFLVLRDIVRIDRHDDAAQAVAGEVAHVLLGPKRAVGADHRMNAALGRVTGHRAEFLVHQRFAADEQQIADVIFDRDVDDVLRFLERDAAALSSDRIDRPRNRRNRIWRCRCW